MRETVLGPLFWFRLIFSAVALGGGALVVTIWGEGFSRDHLITLAVSLWAIGW